MNFNKFTFPPPPPPPPTSNPGNSAVVNPKLTRQNYNGRGHMLRGRIKGDCGFNGSRGGTIHGPPKWSYSEHSSPNPSTRGQDSLAISTNPPLQESFRLALDDSTQQSSISVSQESHRIDSGHFLSIRGNNFIDQHNEGLAANNCTTASLPVPSVGSPLPVLADYYKRGTKRRKSNQLGLTPRTDNLESLQNDGDEESRLAPNMSADTLQFTYRGKTSALHNASDIAAWIEERKRRYPTKARIEARLKEAEKKKSQQEIKKPKHGAMRHSIPDESGDNPVSKVEKSGQNLHPGHAVSKGGERVKRLRKRLAKEEKAIEAKEENNANTARLNDESMQKLDQFSQSAEGRINRNLAEIDCGIKGSVAQASAHASCQSSDLDSVISATDSNSSSSSSISIDNNSDNYSSDPDNVPELTSSKFQTSEHVFPASWKSIKKKDRKPSVNSRSGYGFLEGEQRTSLFQMASLTYPLTQ